MQSQFDFSSLLRHGGYLSTYTPQSLQQLLMCYIPSESSYHLVGIYEPVAIAQIDCWPIIANYCKESLKSKTVVDICLPYSRKKDEPKYIGRYIIYQGKLIGVRLHCKPSHKQYASWPRHQVRESDLPQTLAQDGSNKYRVGEFNLKLNNLRVALLFQDQLKDFHSEYSTYNYGLYSIVSLQCQDVSSTINQIERLKLTSVILQVFSGHASSWLSSVCPLLTTSMKININMKYYDFNPLYKSDQHVEPMHFSTILCELQIDHTISQSKKSIINRPYKLTDQFSVLLNKDQCQPQAVLLPLDSKHYLLERIKRVYVFNRLQKIIVVLDESPITVCILLLLRRFFDEQSQGSDFDYLRTLQFINNSDKMYSAALKLKLLVGPSNLQNPNQIYPFKTLKQISMIAQNHENQEYFPIFTTRVQVSKGIHFMNDVATSFLSNIEDPEYSQWLIPKNQTYELKQLQTLLSINILTEKEVEKWYFEQEVYELLEDSQYHYELWRKFEKSFFWTKLHHRPNFVNSNELIQNISSLPLENFIKQFSIFTKVVDSVTDIPKQKLFCHFFWRKNDFIKMNANSSLLQQMMIVPSQILQVLYRMIASQQNDQHYNEIKMRIREIQALRKLNLSSMYCHHCLFKYPMHLMISCPQVSCQQNFCIKCLTEVFNLSCKENNLLKTCPVCCHMCQKDCKGCEIAATRVRMLADNAAESKGSDRCHICNHKALACFQCSSCERIYCLQCCRRQHSNNPLDSYSNSNWKCYACMQVCTCRSCEITRKRINAVIADLTDKEIDLKRTDFVFKPSIEVTDTDKEPSKVNEIDQWPQVKNRIVESEESQSEGEIVSEETKVFGGAINKTETLGQVKNKENNGQKQIIEIISDSGEQESDNLTVSQHQRLQVQNSSRQNKNARKTKLNDRNKQPKLQFITNLF